MSWQPQASIGRLRSRAQIIGSIRQYFSQHSVLEVDVPTLSEYTVSDPFLDPLVITHQGQQRFLQTSPEYYMKRLLAAGSGDIYYLGNAYRAEEHSRIHSTEFTMLEWYRIGFDDRALMDDLEQLVTSVYRDFAPEQSLTVSRISYQQLFMTHFQLDPLQAPIEALAAIAKRELDVDWPDEERNTWLDLLFSHLIEPKLGEGLVIVYDYPASMCALAKLAKNNQGLVVARRFEAFLGGVELANAYWELTDASEQRKRFREDNCKRSTLNKAQVNEDKYLLAALESGLPECAGIALGIDRLVMAVLGLPSIQQQQAFSP